MKRAIPFLLAVTLAFSLMACGGGSTEAEGGKRRAVETRIRNRF